MAIRRYGRHRVETSNEDKILFAEIGLTKGGLIDYYEAVAETMLPHLRDRALTLQRFPDGIDAEGFYQKQVPEHLPEWIGTTRVTRQDGSRQDLVVCRNRATLAVLANQACITLHAWLSRCDRPDHPDRMVIDLDPPDDDFALVRRGARWVRSLLEDVGLPTFVQLTGSRGVHVTVPLDRSEDFDTVRAFAGDLVGLLARRHPTTLTTEQRRNKRKGRLYLDIGRNAYAQTAVAPYSLRALPRAPVATPVDWEELRSSGIGARRYSVRNVLRRLGQRDDPWKGMALRARGLGAARQRLAEIVAHES